MNRDQTQGGKEKARALYRLLTIWYASLSLNLLFSQLVFVKKKNVSSTMSDRVHVSLFIEMFH